MTTSENETPGNGPLSARDHERILSSIRSDARKIREACDRMKKDSIKLALGGSPASSTVLDEGLTAIHVGLLHIGGVFKVDI